MLPTKTAITGLILAGGQGSRLQGSDKGFVEIGGRTLISLVVERFAPQVGAVLISANRNLDRYARLGYPILSDATGDYPGPLAGIAQGLSRADTPYLAVAPCDSPFLPLDLVARLSAALAAAGAGIAVVRADGRLQPVFALIATVLSGSLQRYLDAGERKIDLWYAQHQMVVVDFPNAVGAFDNVNTEDERRQAEARLLSR